LEWHGDGGNGCGGAVDFVKFGKPASYHSYLAKAWGLVLAAAVVTTLATGYAGLLMRAALTLGVVCLTEGIVMSLILPAWSRDVKTLGSAWQIRREHSAARPHTGVLLEARR
jgi:CDP-diacylglycerol--glycerol-3-phosphate 3-phosphatidyltransferase